MKVQWHGRERVKGAKERENEEKPRESIVAGDK